MPVTMDDLRVGRVKLIFGDPEQIAFLEAERARQDEEIANAGGDERAANPNVLKDYTFLIEGTFSYEATVRAYDEIEAKERLSIRGPDWKDDIEYDVDSNELIKTKVVKDGIEKEAAYDRP